MKNIWLKSAPALVLFLVLCGWACNGSQPISPAPELADNAKPDRARLAIATREDPISGTRISSGIYQVYENRASCEGRMLDLDIVILHAVRENPKPDPVVVFVGGPGASAVTRERGYAESWIRQERDIVLVSQRGTQKSNPLDCSAPGSDDNIQEYLHSAFQPELYRECMEELAKKAELTLYSTFIAAADLNEIRQVLGYDQINVTGSSYGSRAALIYMRQYPDTVRTAMLNGVAPISFRNPLYHSPSAQEALDLLLAECAEDPDCSTNFPDLKEKFYTILERLEQEPAEVEVSHPATLEKVMVELSRDAFAEALRVMMYSMTRNRRIPMLLNRAYQGDYTPFAQLAVESNRGIRRSLFFGMLLCVTCAEDVARINPAEISAVIGDSYLRDLRVRQQMAICDYWPKSKLPHDHAEHVSVNVPVLLLSGTQDPVTPPSFGAEAASHLSNSLHIIAPGAHGVGGPCISRIQQQFLDTGTVVDLDTECVDDLKLSRFDIY